MDTPLANAVFSGAFMLAVVLGPVLIGALLERPRSARPRLIDSMGNPKNVRR